MSTTNLNLFTYNIKSDGDIGFDELRKQMNGIFDSNMTKIDIFSGQLVLNITNLITGYSGSDLSISGSITSASAQVEASGSQITDTVSRFEILGIFSGSGQADFSSISQDYKHLILMGNAASQSPGMFSFIGIDFNGVSTSSSYISVNWERSGSTIPAPTETLSYYDVNGHLILSSVSGSDNYGYGGSVFGVIPNYSGSQVLKKSALGFGSVTQDVWRKSNISGGVWQSASPIDRIRIFGSSGSDTTRYNFVDGTEITLYGVE